MASSKHPVVITALKSKAHLVRQVAFEQSLPYEEALVPGQGDLIRFSFWSLDEGEAIMLAEAIPNEVYAYRGMM